MLCCLSSIETSFMIFHCHRVDDDFHHFAVTLLLKDSDWYPYSSELSNTIHMQEPESLVTKQNVAIHHLGSLHGNLDQKLAQSPQFKCDKCVDFCMSVMLLICIKIRNYFEMQTKCVVL